MISTSAEFLTAAKATVRQPKAKIDVIWTSEGEDSSIVVTSTDANRAAILRQVHDGVTDTPKQWAHLDGLIKANGVYKLMPDPASVGTVEQVGWYGKTRSNASATWTAGFPSLTVTFDARPVISLFVAGDNYWNEYPVDFTIEIYEGLSLEYTETVTGNTLHRWSKALVTESLTSVTSMILTITKWSAINKIVKISEFYTEFLQTLTGDEIVSMNLLEERVIGDGSLPVGNISSNEMDLTLNNVSITVEGTEIIDPFFPSNPNSIYYELIRKNRRVEPYLGFFIENLEGWLKFNGTNSYVKATYTNTVNQTIAFWVNITDFSANYILAGWRQTDAEGATSTSLIRLLSTGKVEFQIVNAAINSYQGGDANITTGWHHIAVTNGDGINPKIYIDSVLAVTISTSIPEQAKFDYFQIGRKSTFVLYPGNFFNGNMYDIAVYDTIKDLAFIQGIYANGIAADADLQLWWECHEVSGNLADSSVNSNIGTVVNADSAFYNPYYSKIEYVKLGVFWTGDWTVNEQDYTASVTCRDRMELLRKAEYKTSTLFEDTTLYAIAESVLNHAKTNIPMLDLTWDIDIELQDYTIDYAWFPRQDYFKTIKQIVEACMGQAYMSKEDVLIIEGPGALIT